MSSDLERERYRRLIWQPDPPRFDAPGGSAAFVGKVLTPGAVGQFMTVNAVTVLGADTVGGTAAVTVDTSHAIAVYLVGPGVPSVGDLLVCRSVDYRWVAERKGTSGGGGGGSCSGLLVPTTPSFVYFACPNGSFGGARANLTMTQGAPGCGLGPFPVYPLGGGFQNHHVTLSASAWYTPFDSSIIGNSAMGTYQNVTGGYICLYFLACNGYLLTIFQDIYGNPFVFNYDTLWTFPLIAAQTTQNNLVYGANTNNPFQIGHATTTQSGNGPALTGQVGPILTGGTGTSTFSTSAIGVPTFSP